MTLKLSAALLAMMLASGPAAAQAGGAGKLDFRALDRNADGSLSRDELSAQVPITSRFDQLDTDRSGSLSDGEFSAFESGGSSNSGARDTGDPAANKPVSRGRSDAGAEPSQKGQSGQPEQTGERRIR